MASLTGMMFDSRLSVLLSACSSGAIGKQRQRVQSRLKQPRTASLAHRFEFGICFRMKNIPKIHILQSTANSNRTVQRVLLGASEYFLGILRD